MKSESITPSSPSSSFLPMEMCSWMHVDSFLPVPGHSSSSYWMWQWGLCALGPAHLSSHLPQHSSLRRMTSYVCSTPESALLPSSSFCLDSVPPSPPLLQDSASSPFSHCPAPHMHSVGVLLASTLHLPLTESIIKIIYFSNVTDLSPTRQIESPGLLHYVLKSKFKVVANI